MQKFLVIQTAFIGDVVLATGLLEKLHSCYADAQIDILVRNGNEALFNNHPYINEVLVWQKKTQKYKHLLQALKKIRSKNYDVIINAQRFAATGFFLHKKYNTILATITLTPFTKLSATIY
jgi:heptosyltransferase-2